MWVSWAFARLFGLSADLVSVQPATGGDGSVRIPFFTLGRSPNSQVTVSLSVWFRSDVTLARNWVER